MRNMVAADELQEALASSKAIYLHTDPEVLDFTVRDLQRVVVMGGGKRIEFQIDPEEISFVMGLFQETVLNAEYVKTLICWDIKSLLSYALHWTGSLPVVTAPVYDLKLIENFLAIPGKRPATPAEATNRLRVVSQDKCWASLYKSLLKPLATRVLPRLETSPVLDRRDHDAKYAHYEPEGQQNGRLRCSTQFAKGFIAHSLGPDARPNIVPRGDRHRFVIADYRNCEVAVLRWLSDDERLATMMKSREDLYEQIYRQICQDECDTPRKRSLMQRLFLAVIYGSSPKGLASILSIPEETARELCHRIARDFTTALRFVLGVKDRAGREVIADGFGRPRDFRNEPYRAQNFIVQSTAATVCLEKLVALSDRLANTPARVCLSIHDSFGVATPENRVHETARVMRDVLESPSELCPGLSLRVKIEVGTSLADMREYDFDQEDHL